MNIYVIDMSSLVHMKRHYPIKRFPSLWRKMEALIEEGRLVSPSRVLEEVKQKDDELLSWCRQRKKMFRREDDSIVKTSAEIVARFNQLSHPEKEVEDADPYVIALAIETNKQGRLNGMKAVVVANEGPKLFHIPDVCRRLNVECIEFIEVINREGWEF